MECLHTGIDSFGAVAAEQPAAAAPRRAHAIAERAEVGPHFSSRVMLVISFSAGSLMGSCSGRERTKRPTAG